MDISDLVVKLSNTYINTSIQAYSDRIIESIKAAAEIGQNTIVYELTILNSDDIRQIRYELLTLFPDMYITIQEKRILIDWS